MSEDEKIENNDMSNEEENEKFYEKKIKYGENNLGYQQNSNDIENNNNYDNINNNNFNYNDINNNNNDINNNDDDDDDNNNDNDNNNNNNNNINNDNDNNDNINNDKDINDNNNNNNMNNYNNNKNNFNHNNFNNNSLKKTEEVIINNLENEKKKNFDSDEIEKNEKKKFLCPWNKKKKKEKQNFVGFFSLFRFGTPLDTFLMVVGTLCAMVHGCCLPLMILVFGDMTNKFVQSSNITNFKNMESPIKEVYNYAGYFAIIGLGVLIVAYFQVSTWLMVSYRMSFKIRTNLFNNVIHQEMGWFDTQEPGQLSTRLADDVEKIQEGIGDKFCTFVQWISMFLAGIIIGLAYGWKLALVIIAVSPLLVISGGLMTYMASKATTGELNAYAKAGMIANEVFTAIRTVVAFSGQEKECQRYNIRLEEAKKYGIKKGIMNGIGMGMVFLVLFLSYALAFWFGGKLIREKELSIGNVLTVFFSIVMGTFALGHAGPSLQAISVARGAAYTIWQLIDRESKIDSRKKDGKTPNELIGNSYFQDVHFSYPSREEIKILQGINLTISKGQTVAIVGSSGCGKSTVVQLLQRFYDVEKGFIFMDDNQINHLNVAWLRNHIAIVSQEPVLFDTTIATNILYGNQSASMSDVIQAAKEANAHDFISNLPDKYETNVGERGAQLSGGQKQRIAIARALIKKPKLLLLDEATSALDTESESIVQAALDKARTGRTTIIIAHRLSTIKNADIICGLENGKVVEVGNHEQLIEKKGIYYTLFMNQQMKKTDEEEGEEDYEDEKFKDIPPLERKISARRSKRSRSGSKRSRSRSRSGSMEENDDKKKEKDKEISFLRVMKYNKKEWYIIILGCLGASIQGAVQPAFAILFAKFLGLYGYGKSVEDQRKGVDIISIMFVVLGVISASSMLLQSSMFAISGEKLTRRIRRLIFKHILKQNIEFFDSPDNSVGALTTRLATDASAVQGATGVRLGMAFQSFSSVGVGIIIGFVYSWELTLLIIACVPFVVVGGALQIKAAKGFSSKNKNNLEKAGKIATEAISNIRTVTSLTLENKFYEDYKKQLEGPLKSNLCKAHLQGILFSFSQAVIFFIDAAIFALGAFLIEQRKLDYESMFIVFGAIMFGAMSLGQASQFAPDYAKAKASIARIFSIFDSNPSINIYSPEGLKPESCEGFISFNKVNFSYPNRKSIKVLNDLDLQVTQGQKVALVGSSGCGKSTIIQLLERFYDVAGGDLFLDKNNVKDLNILWLRSMMGLVSQEPILFDSTIRENIGYGDNNREVPLEEIMEAARKANIANFIENLPQRYDTNVGDKGSQLSGGQKQRIAIARALIRNPKILLLDEATSALDTESEKIVQEALEKAQEGRTCLVIAHRLSTIKDSDCILVLESGKVVEKGNHSELMALKGVYYRLVQVQERKK